MPDPIQIEEMFQELTHNLDEIHSIRHRFYLLVKFIKALDGQYKKYKSYLIQVAYKIPQYSVPITFSGLDPEDIESDIRILQQAKSEVNELNTVSQFQNGLNSLYKACLVQYGFLRNFEKANHYFCLWLGLSEEEVLFNKNEPKENEEILLIGLIDIQERVKELNSEAGNKLSKLITDLNFFIKVRPDSVLIPVIEKFEIPKDPEVGLGRLRYLQIDIIGELEEGNSDQLSKSFKMYGVEQTVWQENKKPLEAARKLLVSNNGKILNKFFKGEVRYQLTNALHVGKSANVAIATLWYTNVQKFTDQRKRYELNSCIAITGDIDEGGNILPIDNESIKSKMEAVFFSWASFLIIPNNQVVKFESALKKLKKRYPGRGVKIFGITNLQDLFFDRRLTAYIAQSKTEYIARRVWRRKSDAASVIMLLLVLTVFGLLIYGPIDKNPSLNTFTGEVLQVKNNSGTILESINVGPLTVQRANSRAQSKFAAFADLTNDGLNEIIWGEIRVEDDDSRKGYLNKKKGGDKDPLWTVPLTYDFEFPNKPFLINPNYYPAKISIDDLSNDGNLNLLVSKDHVLYFPGVLSKRNPLNGDEINHFINTGRIIDFTVADITGDEKKEVIFCGINNAYDMAFLAVASLDQFGGMSPHTEEYRLNGYTVQDNLSYVLLPKSIVSEKIMRTTNYNRAARVSVLENQELIEVYVQDFMQYSGSELQLPATSSYLIFYLNYDLSVRGIGTSDAYDLTAQILKDEGLLESIPDYRYFNSLKDSVLYWDGEGFLKPDMFFGN